MKENCIVKPASAVKVGNLFQPVGCRQFFVRVRNLPGESKDDFVRCKSFNSCYDKIALFPSKDMVYEFVIKSI